MAPALLKATAPSSHAFKASSTSRATNVVCLAVGGRSHLDAHINRRAAVATSLWSAALLFAPKALALIPDEEDEEMLEKAKANRQRRLSQQKETTREFLQVEGLKNKQLDQELIPVQKAVAQLSKSGEYNQPSGLLR